MRTLQTDAPVHWHDITPVSYTLSEDEVAAAVKARAVQTVGGWVAISWLVLGVANIAMGLLRSHFQPQRVLGLDYFYVALGVAYIALSLSQWLLRRLKTDRRRDFALRFSEEGIELGPAPIHLLPWRSIESVNADGESFIFQCAQRAPLLLPKRVFADRGAALWLALETQLIGPYNLRRRPNSQLIINTNSRPTTSSANAGRTAP